MQLAIILAFAILAVSISSATELADVPPTTRTVEGDLNKLRSRVNVTCTLRSIFRGRTCFCELSEKRRFNGTKCFCAAVECRDDDHHLLDEYSFRSNGEIHETCDNCSHQCYQSDELTAYCGVLIPKRLTMGGRMPLALTYASDCCEETRPSSVACYMGLDPCPKPVPVVTRYIQQTSNIAEPRIEKSYLFNKMAQDVDIMKKELEEHVKESRPPTVGYHYKVNNLYHFVNSSGSCSIASTTMPVASTVVTAGDWNCTMGATYSFPYNSMPGPVKLSGTITLGETIKVTHATGKTPDCSYNKLEPLEFICDIPIFVNVTYLTDCSKGAGTCYGSPLI